MSCRACLQDGITAFEALESGVLHSLRELLGWLEGAAATTAARPLLLPGAATATAAEGASCAAAVELERDTVNALALVPAAVMAGGGGVPGGGGQKGGSQAVLEVGADICSGGGGGGRELQGGRRGARYF